MESKSKNDIARNTECPFCGWDGLAFSRFGDWYVCPDCNCPLFPVFHFMDNLIPAARKEFSRVGKDMWR